jgi:hypothetical protein
MDIKQIWEKLEKEKLESSQTDTLLKWPKKSKHPVNKLRQSFLIALLMTVFFLGLFSYLFAANNLLLLRIFIGLVIAAYLFFFVINYRIYREVSQPIDFSDSLLITLKNIYQNIDRMLRFQRKSALFIYPIAASTGFLLGFSESKDPLLVFQNPKLLLSMIGISLILTPLCYWLAIWMEKISYGKYIVQLKDLIDSMEKTATE